MVGWQLRRSKKSLLLDRMDWKSMEFIKWTLRITSAKAPLPFGKLESDLGHLGMRKVTPIANILSGPSPSTSMASVENPILLYKSSKELQYGCGSKSSS